jgi:hypothetical protein
MHVFEKLMDVRKEHTSLLIPVDDIEHLSWSPIEIDDPIGVSVKTDPLCGVAILNFSGTFWPFSLFMNMFSATILVQDPRPVINYRNV